VAMAWMRHVGAVGMYRLTVATAQAIRWMAAWSASWSRMGARVNLAVRWCRLWNRSSHNPNLIATSSIAAWINNLRSAGGRPMNLRSRCMFDFDKPLDCKFLKQG
jgi:hypothetical protein